MAIRGGASRASRLRKHANVRGVSTLGPITITATFIHHPLRAVFIEPLCTTNEISAFHCSNSRECSTLDHFCNSFTDTPNVNSVNLWRAWGWPPARALPALGGAAGPALSRQTRSAQRRRAWGQHIQRILAKSVVRGAL